MTSEGQHKRPVEDPFHPHTSSNSGWIQIALRRLGGWLPFSANCFRCGAAGLQRSSRRNWWEHAIGVVLLPYRCQRCDQRLFKSRWLEIRTK